MIAIKYKLARSSLTRKINDTINKVTFIFCISENKTLKIVKYNFGQVIKRKN